MNLPCSFLFLFQVAVVASGLEEVQDRLNDRERCKNEQQPLVQQRVGETAEDGMALGPEEVETEPSCSVCN